MFALFVLGAAENTRGNCTHEPVVGVLVRVFTVVEYLGRNKRKYQRAFVICFSSGHAKHASAHLVLRCCPLPGPLPPLFGTRHTLAT